MITRSGTFVSVVPIAFFAATLPRAQAETVPVLEFASATNLPVAINAASGWSFTTNQAITVVALDDFDPAGGTNNVFLYDGSGNVLASATVTASDPTGGSPVSFYTQSITPVTLAADTTYYIAANFDSDESGNAEYLATGPTTDPSITCDSGVAGGPGSDPTTDIPAPSDEVDPGFFGPDFDIASATPEPSTFPLALAGFGLAAAALRRRRR